MQSRQRNHQKRFLDSAQALIDGDHEPLAEVLSEETPKGSLGAEKEAIREIAKIFWRDLPVHTSPAHSQSNSDKALLGGEAALDTIQALRIRAISRKLPDGKVLTPLAGIARVQAGLIVAEQFEDKVKDNIAEFSQIPQCMRITHSWHAIGKDGKTLCGQSEDAKQANSETRSFLNAGSIHCQDCKQGLIDKKPLATMTAAELEAEIDDIGLRPMTASAISWGMPRPAMTAKETVDSGLDYCDKRLCERMDLFLMSPPRAFMAKP